MPESNLPDANLTLGALLRRPYERMSDWVYAELAKGGFESVRPAFSAVLRNVPAEGLHVTALAARAGMTKQSMAYLVDQMELAHLAELTPDPADRRAKIVKLTERGLAAGKRAVELSKIYEDRLAGLIGKHQMSALRRILAELHGRLEEDHPDLSIPHKSKS